jgi:hypothetical protein
MPALQEILGYFLKMIQWYLARPCIISGQDARTTRNFGIFFKNDPMVSCPSLFYSNVKSHSQQHLAIRYN